jgi:hypothetical protein
MAHSRICSVDDCGKPHHAHGYCACHAWKFKKYGNALAGRTTAGTGEPQRWIKQHANYQGDDCIRWPFEVTHHGYGTVLHSGKKRVASRVMCEEAHGLPPSPDMEAAHLCGNGHNACMNQRHMSWKSRLGNLEDAKAHGTWQRGNVRKATVLNPQMVREIRALDGTMLQKEIAARFGISPRNVQKVLARTNWAWVDDDQYVFRTDRRMGDRKPASDAGSR